MITIDWKSVDELSNGHGVLIIYLPIKKSVAFIDGYGWYHGTTNHVIVELLKNDSNFFKSEDINGHSILEKAKDTIVVFLNNKNNYNGNFQKDHFGVWFNA
jgi:hypothetical protein